MQLNQLVFVTLCVVASVFAAPAPVIPVHNDARILEPAVAY